jgi:hypothetical protein
MSRHVRRASQYRRELEALVLAAKGEVDLKDAHTIDLMTTCEMHAGLCRWLLRAKLEKMSPSDIARASEQILKSKVERNKVFEKLGIDRLQRDAIDALYDQVGADPDPAPALPDAPSVSVGDADHIPGG